jgi:cytochrome P450
MTISPDVQHKLRNHILEVMPEVQDRPPTLEDLTPGKMPYLEAVVQETLRLSRTAGGYSREGMFESNFSIIYFTTLLPCAASM